MEWDVRTTGSDSNGGGFKNGASGTDYSQQNAAQVAYTDLVIDASLNTKVTSAATPFTSAHVGNIINVTGGTGFTTGRYEVVSVASSAATLDRAVGTTSSTGGTGNLGGSLLTVATAVSSQDTVGDQLIWIKSGTHTITAAIVPNQNIQYSFIGYGATHGDNGTPPNIACATNGVKSFSFTSGKGFFKNLRITSTASTATNTYGICADYNYPELACEDVEVSGFRFGISYDSGNWAGMTLVRCNITGNYVQTVYTTFRASFYGCKLADQGYNGTAAVSVPNAIFFKCLFYNNAGAALHVDSSHMAVVNCAFKGNNTGIDSGSVDGFTLINNIFVGNVLALAGGGNGIQRNNAFYNNTTKRSDTTYRPGNQSAFIGDITLTGDPFVSTSDWSLNGTAGAGLACQQAGLDVSFTVSPALPDVGPVQTSGGGSCDYPAAGDVRDGVSFDSGGSTGTLELPAEATVQAGVQYGEDGTEFTGSYSPAPSGVINPFGGIIG